MKMLKNEDGYSLLTVILMMTIFTIIFLAFFSYSFNTVKQNKVVETQTQSVSLSEMGVSFFQTAITDIYEDKQSEVNNYILGEIAKDNPVKSNDDYTNLAINKMDELIRKGLKDQLGFDPAVDPHFINEINSDSSYTIKDFHMDKDLLNNEIKINFNSIGKDGVEDAPLRSDMTISVTSKTNNTGGINIGLKLPNFNQVQKPSGCISVVCGDLLDLIDGVLDWLVNNLNNVTNKTVYSTSGLSLGKNDNINSSENLSIHAVENINILGNVNSAVNLLLETQGNATFGSQLNTSGNSKVFIKNDLTTNGNTDFLGSSLVYVGKDLINNKHLNLGGTSTTLIEGNAKINDKLNMSSSAKMCVKGNVEINNLSDININSNIGLIVKNKILVNGEEYLESITGVTTGKEHYEQICEPSLPYSWADGIHKNVNYSY